MRRSTYPGRRTSSSWGIANRSKSICTCRFDRGSTNLTVSVRAWAGSNYFSIPSMKIWNKRWLKILIIGASSMRPISGTSSTSSSRPSSTTKRGKNPWIAYALKMCSFWMMERSRYYPKISSPTRISQALSIPNSVRMVLLRDRRRSSGHSPFGSLLTFAWTIHRWNYLPLCGWSLASRSFLR